MDIISTIITTQNIDIKLSSTLFVYRSHFEKKNISFNKTRYAWEMSASVLFEFSWLQRI